MAFLSRVSYWRKRWEGQGVLELETEHLSERELGDLCIISDRVLGIGLLWAAEPASLGAVKAAWRMLVELCWGLSTAVCAAAPQLEPGLQGAAPNTAALCSLWRALLFGFAFIAGFLLCPHGTSQTLTLIKKSNEFWSMESDLDQAEVRTESFVPSLWTRLLSRHFTPRPSPGHAARRSVLWCWPSLTAAFCSAICHWLFLILVHVWVTEAFLVWLCQRSSPAELPWGGFSAGAVLHRRQGCDALSRHEVNNANLTPVKAQKWNSSNFKNPV